MKKREQKKLFKFLVTVIVIILIGIIGYFNPNFRSYIDNILEINTTENETIKNSITNNNTQIQSTFDLNSIPEYTSSPYVTINNNKPNFLESDYTKEPFEKYSELDSLGRCGVAYANICKEIMPVAGEKRGEIGSIHPSGWQTTKYEGLVDGNYLYNRSHLIGWQLAGENANKLNLITGTRYMNVTGMLPFENIVDDYFEDLANQNNHVLYRVTPIYTNTNLVANGVQMEAYSVEDNGQGVSFNIYVYNVQPGIEIDYATGKSKLK